MSLWAAAIWFPAGMAVHWQSLLGVAIIVAGVLPSSGRLKGARKRQMTTNGIESRYA